MLIIFSSLAFLAYLYNVSKISRMSHKAERTQNVLINPRKVVKSGDLSKQSEELDGVKALINGTSKTKKLNDKEKTFNNKTIINKKIQKLPDAIIIGASKSGKILKLTSCKILKIILRQFFYRHKSINRLHEFES